MKHLYKENPEIRFPDSIVREIKKILCSPRKAIFIGKVSEVLNLYTVNNLFVPEVKHIDDEVFVTLDGLDTFKSLNKPTEAWALWGLFVKDEKINLNHNPQDDLRFTSPYLIKMICNKYGDYELNLIDYRLGIIYEEAELTYNKKVFK